jgi:arsenical pump membrane protein
MEQVIAYSTLAMTVGLAVTRPRIGKGELRVTPGLAAVLGVFVLVLAGLLPVSELWTSARVQWRPLCALTCIMIMTGVVKEVGAFDRLAVRIEAYARRTSRARAFNLVFFASVVTPSLLNNDAAILLLTPIVVVLARRLYPGEPRLLEAFVFAVFLAPGVAPFIISNPMNMIVAEYAGLDFNSYALVMAPISLAGALLTFAMLRVYYRAALAEPVDAVAPPRRFASAAEPPPRHPAERPALGLLLLVFLSYPVVASTGTPIWPIAVVGAAGCLVIVRVYGVAPVRKIAGHVSLDILAFLWGVFLVVAGLRAVGVVDSLHAFYESAGSGGEGAHLAVIGVTSAVGSAIIDNHPMSILNMMALGDRGSYPLLAALIGGDIGPRLLPIGSLAGLLWMDLLRRRGVDIGIGRFVRLGTLVLIPTLALSLWMLWML